MIARLSTRHMLAAFVTLALLAVAKPVFRAGSGRSARRPPPS